MFSLKRIQSHENDYVSVPFFPDIISSIKNGGIVDVCFPMRCSGLTTLSWAISAETNACYVSGNSISGGTPWEKDVLKDEFKQRIILATRNKAKITTLVFDQAESLTERLGHEDLCQGWKEILSDFASDGITIVLLHCDDVCGTGQLTTMASSKFRIPMWTIEVVNRLSNKSGIRLDENELHDIYELTGGHPLLTKWMLRFFVEQTASIEDEKIHYATEKIFSDNQAEHKFNWMIKYSSAISPNNMTRLDYLKDVLFGKRNPAANKELLRYFVKNQVLTENGECRIGLIKEALKRWPNIPSTS